MPELKVGQSLWLVPSDRRYEYNARTVTVTRVGRKWAYLDFPSGSRVSRETLAMDGRGYSAQWHCYLSRDAWESTQANQGAWERLFQFVHRTYRCPAHLNAEKIARLMDVLTGPACVEVTDAAK